MADSGERVGDGAPDGYDGVEQRRNPRRRVLLSGILVHSPEELTLDCSILELSKRGARIRIPPENLIRDPIWLVNLTHGLAFRSKVVWSRGGRLGLAFAQVLDLKQADDAAPATLRRLYREHTRAGID
ncbi:MAG TPA: PilZ domain-containing protein [Caulobacteraceae bacterium]|nr:PilZ domain-containing protein [Caulobacteraceae bacterium]